jgi:hypothetical protein
MAQSLLRFKTVSLKLHFDDLNGNESEHID